MKILALAWEFPPRIVGGIARHVAELYPEIVRLGHEVHLITVEFGQAPGYEVVEGIFVHRVPVGPANDFFHWIVLMNEAMGNRGGKLLLEDGPFDILHAHDWLVQDAGTALKHNFRVPLVSTVHATEYGRYNGIWTDTQRYIHLKEFSLVFESWRTIVCTEYMRGELQRAFGCPWDKLDVLPNGIKAAKKERNDFDRLGFRRRFAYDHEKIVYYVGRMAHEKGVQFLIEAMPRVLWEYPDAKFVIIGGGNIDHLKRRVGEMGLWNKCYFTGFMPDDDLDRFQQVADCAVFPSLYEPFGIVALESFAAGVPVVVSDTGGLPEVVNHTRTGVVTYTGNPESLAWGILEVIRNPGYAQWLKDNAREAARSRFNWEGIARATVGVYARVAYEREHSPW
ncbi:glycosyltransferase family 4 protein [Gloeobacter kilaueensis]|uniref:Glycosyl transferase group 1 n=1 Tax=Gloeobacter kilaueensis (strain ATCC BAA-2537 / CCAP 1431/1 / ULC 316 / JS1) TaxID=1183438 RepID=U5QJL5_GLOK1|nr:glycosyltransferase family 4 protein [Gloeobacter kilaueensis]AGY57794.1 glycosyl transferase group 1 [Gloeobacter kilaueensis JS1]